MWNEKGRKPYDCTFHTFNAFHQSFNTLFFSFPFSWNNALEMCRQASAIFELSINMRIWAKDFIRWAQVIFQEWDECQSQASGVNGAKPCHGSCTTSLTAPCWYIGCCLCFWYWGWRRDWSISPADASGIISWWGGVQGMPFTLPQCLLPFSNLLPNQAMIIWFLLAWVKAASYETSQWDAPSVVFPPPCTTMLHPYVPWISTC